MVSDPAPDDPSALRAWSDQLACPVCHARLALEQRRIVCPGCGRVYPVENGIAVLIAERATFQSLA